MVVKTADVCLPVPLLYLDFMTYVYGPVFTIVSGVL